MSAPCRVRRGKGYEACDDEAVSLCCTFPEVAFGGRYPLSLPCGARTFLTEGPFAPSARLSVFLAGLLYAKQRAKSMGSRSIRENQSLIHGVEAGETPAGQDLHGLYRQPVQ